MFKGFKGGSDEGQEDQGKIPLRKNPGCLGVFTREECQHSSKSRVMVHICDVHVFEGRGNGGWITWSKLFVPEEVGEVLHYQGNRDSETFCLPSTTPSTKDSPLSVIDGLGGWNLRGCNPICFLLEESVLAKRLPDSLQT